MAFKKKLHIFISLLSFFLKIIFTHERHTLTLNIVKPFMVLITALKIQYGLNCFSVRRICTVNWKIHELLTQVFTIWFRKTFNYLWHPGTQHKRAESNCFSFYHYYYQGTSIRKFDFLCFLQLG